MSYRIKGLILLSHLLSPQEIEELPVPVITIERTGGNYKQINNDNFTGGKLAAELLIQNDCDVFIHINNAFDHGFHSCRPAFPSAWTVIPGPLRLVLPAALVGSIPIMMQGNRAVRTERARNPYKQVNSEYIP